MDKVTFRVIPHSMLPNVEVVEVLCNGNVCAAIYPGMDKTIKVISAHFAGNQTGPEMPGSIRMDESVTRLPVPTLLITFDPRPYRIEAGGIVREN